MTIGQTPGVYIDEVAGPGAIDGVPTWGAAFLGHSWQALPDVPTLITSWDDFEANYGAPVWRSYLAWAVSQFFDEGGVYCWVMGVKKTGDPAVAANVVFTSNTAQGETTAFSAASNGVWGNLLWVSVGLDPSDPNAKIPKGLTTITVGVRDCDINPACAGSWSNDQLKSAGLTDRALLWNFVRTNSIDSVTATLSSQETDAIYVLESFAGLSTASKGGIAKRINLNSSFILFSSTCDESKFVLPFADGWYPLGGGLASIVTYPTQNGGTVAGNKGVDSTIGVGDYGTAIAKLEGIQGVSLVCAPDIVSIEDTAPNTFKEQLDIVSTIAAECEKPGLNWFYVVDPPPLLAATDAVAFKDGDYNGQENNGATNNPVSSSYAALFWPWLTVPHPTTGNQFFSMPPSGAVLGRFVYTDLKIGVQQAAAGVNFGALAAVSSLDVSQGITDALQDVVYPQGLNVIRSRIYYGICIWGARTLSPDPEWRYIPVRRLFNYVEKSLVEGLQQFIFDVNNVHLWVRVTREVTWFLVGLWKSGALFGRTQDEAFRVTCDDTNNTAATMQQGYLYVKVEIAPVRPAEYIVIQISQKLANAKSGT